MQRYSVQFRNTILQKMIGPEKRKAADLSEKFGVSAATIYGWKSKLKDGTLSVMGNESTRSLSDFSCDGPAIPYLFLGGAKQGGCHRVRVTKAALM